MKSVVRTVLPIVAVVIVLGAVAIAVFQGITEPAHTVLGVTSRHADIVACWILFLGLPLACAIDAARFDPARWIMARRHKFGWIAAIAYLPCIGPLLYVTLARPRVAGESAASRA
jgi:cytochrome c biogenesis protein CcdA